MRQQGITGPQGLAALMDPDWQDDEASARYLDLMLGDEPPTHMEG